ncbi:MFS transporter [bacterium LRH843]|nr:MFS transporter [bacterium LRH843]
MESPKQPIWTKAFISLFFTNMTVFTIFYGLISTLPLYAKDVLSRTDEEAGLLISIFLLSAIICRPFTGKVLDLVGKRKMLWISLLFYLLCTILYYFISPFTGLLILRFVQGIWFSIATTASGTLAADNVPMNRRGTGLGYFAMSTNLAVVVGPFIGLFIIQSFSFDLLFILLSVLMLVGALFSLVIPADETTKAAPSKRKLSIDDLFEKKALPIAILASLLSFSYASVLSYLSIYAQQKDLLSLASTFFLVFAAAMVLTRPFTGRIFDLKGPQFILIPAFISFIIGLVLLAFMNSPFTFLLAGIFFGLGYGGLVPSLQTLAIQATNRERSGYATATFFTFFDLGIAIGSYVLGLIAVYFGYQQMYLVSGVIVLGVFFLYLKMYKKNKQTLRA